MRKVYYLAVAAFFCFFINACHYDGDVINVVKNAAYEENRNFETRGIPIISETDSNVTYTVYARVYDENDYVPYVGVNYWLSVLGVGSVWSYSDGEYTIMADINGKNFPLLINHKNSTIYCPKWVGFARPDPTFSFAQGTKFIEVQKTFIGQKAATFDLAKYGFKIYAGIDDVYIPLYVANQFFTCAMLQNRLLYNGNKIYNYNELVSFSTFKNSSWYTDSQGKLTNRPQKLIDISYNMLCMTHDYLYGQPGYYGFADNDNGYAKEDIVADADKLSFDQMLSKYDPDTKELLKSYSYVDYLTGLRKLTANTYGDEHSSLSWNTDSFLYLDNQDIKNAINSVEVSGKWKHDKKVTAELHKERIAAGIEDDSGDIVKTQLIDDGKTLIIRFDSFWWKSDAWINYYSSLSSISQFPPDPSVVSLPDDTVGLFYKAFYQIQNDRKNQDGDYKDVKTVLIDDSLNGGGVVYVLQWMLYLLTGSGDLCYEDSHTGTRYHEYARSDLNLDGKVNNGDVEYRKNFADLNIAILCSFNSFSCGNSLPFVAQERGIKILGEQSGGGSCYVGVAVTADGFPFNYSFNMRMCNESFTKTVENGAIPDKILKYSEFYNETSLVNALKEVFPTTY